MSTEKKYIDVDEAFEVITDFAGQAETKSAYGAYWKAAKAIKNLPSVAVAPVKVGSWEFNDKYATVCSVCKTSPYKGLDADIWSAWEPPYCPNCGAKMKEMENKE